jgi:Ca-activated chloride channel family protein
MTQMDRDIVLNIDLAREHEPSAEIGKGPDGAAYVAVSFLPEFEVDELTQSAPGETIFVLDCSGSMQGESIEQATRALELCLRSLSPGDTFNICRFGSTFEMMSSEPLVYSQPTLSAALQYIDRRADLGGTEILPALQAIFETKPRTGTARADGRSGEQRAGGDRPGAPAPRAQSHFQLRDRQRRQRVSGQRARAGDARSARIH